MKAYELFQQDQVGSSMLNRDDRRERRQYYLTLREALREECAGGGRCDLITELGERLKQKQLPVMYLLDAAAVWECYEHVIEGSRFSRDIGRGLPFPVEGRILPWDEVQRLSGNGNLPVAVVDDELGNRLMALVSYAAARGVLRERLPVNMRAGLYTADPRSVQLPENKPEKLPEEKTPPVKTPADSPVPNGETQLRLDALLAENAALRSQLQQLQMHQNNTRDYAIRAANSFLAGKTEEARAIASQLEEKLQSAVEELESAVTARRTLEEGIARAAEKLETERTQTEALRRQEQEVRQSTEAMRSEREQAQRDAAQSAEEQKAAQAELDAAMALLRTRTQTLRSLRQKAADARRACEVTQRQIEGLS